MNILSTYIKTITFYVVFINIIEMIMPSEKYSSYIRLFLGLILIYIVIKPVFLFNINSVNSDILQNYENYITANSENIDVQNIEETRINLVTNNYIQNKKIEIVNLIESNTKYEVVNCDIEIDKDTKTYGEIKNIQVTLNSKEEKLIEEIEIVDIEKNDMSNNVENDEILEIENIIKEVYNLSLNNININIVN